MYIVRSIRVKYFVEKIEDIYTRKFKTGNVTICAMKFLKYIYTQ